MKTPLTADRLKQHVHYHGWKYAVLIILSVLAWDLIFQVTAYRPPADKTVHVYIVSGGGQQEAMNAVLEQIRQSRMPEMEDISAVMLMGDDYYGDMQIGTYMAAGEGDLYLLNADRFQSYAGQGAFIPLDDKTALLSAVEAAGIDPAMGMRTESESRQRHLYGIPAKDLKGLRAYGIEPEQLYFCVPQRSENADNAIRLMQLLIERFTENTKTE